MGAISLPLLGIVSPLIAFIVVFFIVPLPGTRSLRIQDITHSSMNVLWDPVPGKVRKYILRYKIADEDEIKEVDWKHFSKYLAIWRIILKTASEYREHQFLAKEILKEHDILGRYYKLHTYLCQAYTKDVGISPGAGPGEFMCGIVALEQPDMSYGKLATLLLVAA